MIESNVGYQRDIGGVKGGRSKLVVAGDKMIKCSSRFHTGIRNTAIHWLDILKDSIDLGCYHLSVPFS